MATKTQPAGRWKLPDFPRSVDYTVTCDVTSFFIDFRGTAVVRVDGRVIYRGKDIELAMLVVAGARARMDAATPATPTHVKRVHKRFFDRHFKAWCARQGLV